MERDREREVALAQQQAAAAKSLLDNKLFGATLEALEARYVGQWRSSAPASADQRDEAYWMLRALDHVRRDLEALVDGGDVATFNARNVFRR